MLSKYRSRVIKLAISKGLLAEADAASLTDDGSSVWTQLRDHGMLDEGGCQKVHDALRDAIVRSDPLRIERRWDPTLTRLLLQRRLLDRARLTEIENEREALPLSRRPSLARFLVDREILEASAIEALQHDMREVIGQCTLCGELAEQSSKDPCRRCGWLPRGVHALFAEDDPFLNRTLGGWLLSRKLGQGGMGAVYLARHTKLDRDVAVKILPHALAVQRGFRERFMREARMASRIDHPGVVKVYDVGCEDKTYYMVQELIEGDSLQKRLDALSPWPAADAVRLVREAAQALAVTHATGVIHRDIKPDNLVLGSDGLKVVDFGLARAEDGTALSLTGELAGSPGFMSPEQALGEALDHRTDIYSLGVTLYALLTGDSPQAGSNLMQSLAAAIHHPIPPLPDGFPPALDDIIARMTAKPADARYRNMTEVDDALLKVDVGATRAVRPEDVLARQSSRRRRAQSDTGATLVDPRGPSASARRPIPAAPAPAWQTPQAIAAGAVCLLALVALLAFALSGSDAPPTPVATGSGSPDVPVEPAPGSTAGSGSGSSTTEAPGSELAAGSGSGSTEGPGSAQAPGSGSGSGSSTIEAPGSELAAGSGSGSATLTAAGSGSGSGSGSGDDAELARQRRVKEAYDRLLKTLDAGMEAHRMMAMVDAFLVRHEVTAEQKAALLERRAIAQLTIRVTTDLQRGNFKDIRKRLAVAKADSEGMRRQKAYLTKQVDISLRQNFEMGSVAIRSAHASGAPQATIDQMLGFLFTGELPDLVARKKKLLDELKMVSTKVATLAQLLETSAKAIADGKISAVLRLLDRSRKDKRLAAELKASKDPRAIALRATDAIARGASEWIAGQSPGATVWLHKRGEPRPWLVTLTTPPTTSERGRVTGPMGAAGIDFDELHPLTHCRWARTRAPKRADLDLHAGAYLVARDASLGKEAAWRLRRAAGSGDAAIKATAIAIARHHKLDLARARTPQTHDTLSDAQLRRKDLYRLAGRVVDRLQYFSALRSSASRSVGSKGEAAHGLALTPDGRVLVGTNMHLHAFRLKDLSPLGKVDEGNIQRLVSDHDTVSWRANDQLKVLLPGSRKVHELKGDQGQGRAPGCVVSRGVVAYVQSRKPKAGGGATARLWSRTRRLKAELQLPRGSTGILQQMASQPRQRWVVAVVRRENEYGLALYKLGTRATKLTPIRRHDGGVLAGGQAIHDLAFNPTGKQLVLTRAADSRLVHDVGARTLKTTELVVMASSTKREVLQFADWHPTGELFAVVGNLFVGVFSAEGEPLARIRHASRGVRGLRWSPDGEALVALLHDGTLQVFRPGGGK